MNSQDESITLGKRRITYTGRFCFLLAFGMILIIISILFLLINEITIAVLLFASGLIMIVYSIDLFERNDRIEIYEHGIKFIKKKHETVIRFEDIIELVTIAIRIEGLVNSLDCYRIELLVRTDLIRPGGGILVGRRYSPVAVRDYLSKYFGLTISQTNYDKADWKQERRKYLIL